MTRSTPQDADTRGANRDATRGTKRKDEARAAILDSVRTNLRASAPHDARRAEHVPHDETAEANAAHADDAPVPNDSAHSLTTFDDAATRVRLFEQNLVAVGGRCYEATSESAAAAIVRGIIAEASVRGLKIESVAVSDAASIRALTRHVAAAHEMREIRWIESASVDEMFACDAGLTAAQHGVAETGTLVLAPDAERHRHASLVPPLHIAVLRAQDIRRTLGEALRDVHEAPDGLSRTVTFITGPSRTADIELTLALGVHGPQELHVVIITGEEEKGEADLVSD